MTLFVPYEKKGKNTHNTHDYIYICFTLHRIISGKIYKKLITLVTYRKGSKLAGSHGAKGGFSMHLNIYYFFKKKHFLV